MARTLVPRTIRTAFMVCALSGAVHTALAQVSPSPAPAAAPAEDRCAALANGHLELAELKSATHLAAGSAVAGTGSSMPAGPGAGKPISGLPGFCRVIGSIHAEPGSDIHFEVWLPTDWNGRLKGAGNGGFAGSIAYGDLAAAVRAGQIGVSTDTGHSAANAIQIDGSWAKGHPERLRDYGWRAIHLSTVAAKQLARDYYGRSPDFAYFASCSNGGRQALMEATRFPEDYDGIMAGAPAAEFTDLILSMIWTAQVQEPPGAAMHMEQSQLLQQEVLAQCDALDGQTDGLISDPQRCKFDPSKLACGISNSPQCFTPPQLDALRKIYAGPHDAAGRRVAPAFGPGGAEGADPSIYLGWGTWIMGGEGKSSGSQFARAFLQDLVDKPFTDIAHFDFNKDPARLKAAVSGDLDVQPDVHRFFDRGGKLILWHGWGDAAIPPQATLDLHEAILRKSGPKARHQMRLFMVPGLQHCFAGNGPTDFGQVGVPLASDSPERNISAALQAWVEKGRVPDSVVGLRGGPLPAGLGLMIPGLDKAPSTKPTERLICAYPAKAALTIGSDPDKASSYRCK